MLGRTSGILTPNGLTFHKGAAGLVAAGLMWGMPVVGAVVIERVKGRYRWRFGAEAA